MGRHILEKVEKISQKRGIILVGTVAAATVCSVGTVVGIYRPNFIRIGWRNPADTKDYWYRLAYVSQYHK
jgi:cadmium resistance protein CadD (predicted permease)